MVLSSRTFPPSITKVWAAVKLGVMMKIKQINCQVVGMVVLFYVELWHQLFRLVATSARGKMMQAAVPIARAIKHRSMKLITLDTR